MPSAGSARSRVAVVEDAERLRERLRLANAGIRAARVDGRRLVAHFTGSSASSGAHALLYRLGPERFADRVLLAWARSPRGAARRSLARAGDAAGALDARRHFRSRPPTSSRAGSRKGRGSAPRLRAAEEAWIAAGFRLDAAALAAIADTAVAELR